MNHLTEEELSALDLSDLKRDAPFIIQGVSRSMFSVARHYMGCTFQGYFYGYVPPTDELIRSDVIKWLGKRRATLKKASKAIRESSKQLPL